MKAGEWTVVRKCLEQDEKARVDLEYLSKLLKKEGDKAKSGENGNVQQAQATTQVQAKAESAVADAAKGGQPAAPA